MEYLSLDNDSIYKKKGNKKARIKSAFLLPFSYGRRNRTGNSGVRIHCDKKSLNFYVL